MSTFELSDDEMSSFFSPTHFGMGAYADYDWLRIDLENAKQLAHRGGSAQAARQMALNSYQNFRPANVAEQGWGQELLDSALSYIDASAGGGEPIPVGEFGMGSLGAMWDFDWFNNELSIAKSRVAGGTGNVDAARQMALNAWSRFKPATFQEQTQGQAALGETLSYIETFRGGSSILSSGYSSATGAIRDDHQSREGEYAAEREAEAKRLAMARLHPWLYGAQVDKIPGGMQVIDTVDRLGKIMNDPIEALKKIDNVLAIAKAGLGIYVGYRAYKWIRK